MGNGAYGSISTLTTATVEDGVETIPVNMFLECAKLNSIKLPDSLTKIDHNAFNGCKALEEITIPRSVTSFGQKVFTNSGIKSVTVLAETPPEIDNTANKGTFFSITNNYSIIVPQGKLTEYNEKWTSVTDKIKEATE